MTRFFSTYAWVGHYEKPADRSVVNTIILGVQQLSFILLEDIKLVSTHLSLK